MIYSATDMSDEFATSLNPMKTSINTTFYQHRHHYRRPAPAPAPAPLSLTGASTSIAVEGANSDVQRRRRRVGEEVELAGAHQLDIAHEALYRLQNGASAVGTTVTTASATTSTTATAAAAAAAAAATTQQERGEGPVESCRLSVVAHVGACVDARQIRL